MITSEQWRAVLAWLETPSVSEVDPSDLIKRVVIDLLFVEVDVYGYCNVPDYWKRLQALSEVK